MGYGGRRLRAILAFVFVLGTAFSPPVRGISCPSALEGSFDRSFYVPHPEKLLPRSEQPLPLWLRAPEWPDFQGWVNDGQPLVVVSYNVLNLKTFMGQWVPDPSTGVRRMKNGQGMKSPKKTRAIARILQQTNADIVCLQEVEGIRSLEEFNLQYLAGAYRPVMIEGNDGRGIQVGFLVKKTLPLSFAYYSFRNEPYQSAVYRGRGRLFSRDVPALVAYAPGAAYPLFICLGTHFKSKRTDKDFDFESRILRGDQVKRAGDIVAFFQGRYPQVPLFFMGDFNGTVHSEPQYQPLFQLGLKDTLDLGANPIAVGDPRRVTHTYHPIDRGAVQAHQIDAILVNGAGAASVELADVIPYFDDEGRERPLPKTLRERNKQPSDHRAVRALLDKKNLIRLIPWRPAPGRLF